MKKLLPAFCLIGTITISFGQTVNLGIKAGINFSEQTNTGPAYSSGNFLTGFNAGGVVNIGFNSFSIQPGLQFSTKGGQQQITVANANDSQTQNVSAKTTLDYIEIPVNVLYKFNIATRANIHLGGGPYLAYGVSESIPDLNTSSSSPSIIYSHQSFSYKNPDYGINFIAGFTLNKVFLDAGYGFGVANLSQGSTSVHNQVVSISAGFLF